MSSGKHSSLSVCHLPVSSCLRAVRESAARISETCLNDFIRTDLAYFLSRKLGPQSLHLHSPWPPKFPGCPPSPVQLQERACALGCDWGTSRPSAGHTWQPNAVSRWCSQMCFALTYMQTAELRLNPTTYCMCVSWPPALVQTVPGKTLIFSFSWSG